MFVYLWAAFRAVRYGSSHDGDCECRECHPLTAKCPRCGKSRLEAKFEICCM